MKVDAARSGLIFPTLSPAAWTPAATAAITGGNVSIESVPPDSGGGAGLAGGSVEMQGILGQWMLPAGSMDSLAGGVLDLRSGFFNPPRLSRQDSSAFTLSSADGGLVMSLPAGAVDPATISRANAKMRANNGPLAAARSNDVWGAGKDDLGREGGERRLCLALVSGGNSKTGRLMVIR